MNARLGLWSVLVAGLVLFGHSLPAGDLLFVRGDANFDDRVDIADAIFILGYQFQGTRAPNCFDAADANDDGRVDISDSIFILGHLFTGTAAPPDPYPAAGSDPTLDSLDCQPPPPVVVRRGNLVEWAYPVGGRVEQLSDGTIRISSFYYDGGGPSGVFVWLHKSLGLQEERAGIGISPDLSGRSYAGETLVYPIPPEITDGMFDYVSIYCQPGLVNYGYARLFR